MVSPAVFEQIAGESLWPPNLGESNARRVYSRLCAHQGIKNVGFFENFAYVLNEWSQKSKTTFAL